MKMIIQIRKFRTKRCHLRKKTKYMYLLNLRRFLNVAFEIEVEAMGVFSPVLHGSMVKEKAD